MEDLLLVYEVSGDTDRKLTEMSEASGAVEALLYAGKDFNVKHEGDRIFVRVE